MTNSNDFDGNFVLNCQPSKDIDQDWQLDSLCDAGIMNISTELPEEVDLRENDWWCINNQGNTGSCVGWAVADSVLRWHFVKKGLIKKNDLLSVRFIWMASKETDRFVNRPTTFIEDSGTSIKTALDVARKFGIVPDKMLPFSSENTDDFYYKGREETFYAIASRYKINGYINLGINADNCKTWLANVGPVVTRLNIDYTFKNAKIYDGYLDYYDRSTAMSGHAVAIVGYTQDRFIIRNSWGTDNWGDNGYAYASYEYAQNAFTEAYGVYLI